MARVIEGPAIYRPAETTTVIRKSIDPAALIIRSLESRAYTRDWRDRAAVLPHSSCAVDVPLPLDDPSDVAQGICTRLQSVNPTKSPIYACAFHPVKPLLQAAARNGRFFNYSTVDFKLVTEIPTVHAAQIMSLKWSPSGEFLASSDTNGCVAIWDADSKLMHSFFPHKETVTSIDFSPFTGPGMKLITGAADGVIKQWPFAALAMGGGGGSTGGDGSATGGVDSAVKEQEYVGHGSAVTSVAWHPYKALIATGSKDTSVRLWDPSTGKVITSLPRHSSRVLRVAWNRVNGHWLASTSADQTTRIVDIRTMRDFAVIPSEHKGATAVAWHPHLERLLLTAHFDGCLQYHDVGACVPAPLGEVVHAHDSAVWDGAFCANNGGILAATVGADGTAKFWARSRPGDTGRQYAYQGNTVRGYASYEEDPTANTSGIVPVPPGVTASVTAEAAAAMITHSIGASAAAAAGGGRGGALPVAGLMSMAKGTGAMGGHRGGATTAGGSSFSLASALGLGVSDMSDLLGGGGSAATAAGGGVGANGGLASWEEADAEARYSGGGGGGGGGGGAPGSAFDPFAAAGVGSFGGAPAAAGGGVGSAAVSTRGPVPKGYVCDFCKIPGHWKQDCPVKGDRGGGRAGGGGGGPRRDHDGGGGGGDGTGERTYGPPPDHYTCHGCGQKGHWKYNCPRLRAIDGPRDGTAGPAGAAAGGGYGPPGAGGRVGGIASGVVYAPVLGAPQPPSLLAALGAPPPAATQLSGYAGGGGGGAAAVMPPPPPHGMMMTVPAAASGGYGYAPTGSSAAAGAAYAPPGGAGGGALPSMHYGLPPPVPAAASGGPPPPMMYGGAGVAPAAPGGYGGGPPYGGWR